MQASELSALTLQVLWAGFLVFLWPFGVIAQRTHFCTMGAISDVVNFGDWTRMRQWGHGRGGVAMIGFSSHGLWRVGSTLARACMRPHAGSGFPPWWEGLSLRLRHGVGLGLRQQDAGAHWKRQSQVLWWSFLVMGLAAFATLKGIDRRPSALTTVDRVALDLSHLEPL
jgi:hypothetical protein